MRLDCGGFTACRPYAGIRAHPAVGELRDILQRCEDARVEVAALQKTVKEMSGLDRDLLS